MHIKENTRDTVFTPDVLDAWPHIKEAVRRGEQLTQQVWSSREMLTASEAAGRLGTSRQTINRLRQARKLLGVNIKGNRAYRYPSWQFDITLTEGVRSALGELCNYSDWGAYFFFIDKEPLLDARMPLDVIRAGDSEKVVKVAIILNESAE